MDIFALVEMSPRRMVSILMLQVTASALLESLPVSTEAGRFLRVSTAVPLDKMCIRDRDASIADKYYDPPLVNVIKFACNRCPEKLVKVSDL